jgi:hypothetical protein
MTGGPRRTAGVCAVSAPWRVTLGDAAPGGRVVVELLHVGVQQVARCLSAQESQGMTPVARPPL